MKRFFKYIIIAFVALSTLGLESCSIQRKASQPKEKLQILSLDKVKGNLKEGIKATITVENNTAFNLQVTEATAFLMYNGKKIGRVAINLHAVGLNDLGLGVARKESSRQSGLSRCREGEKEHQ